MNDAADLFSSCSRVQTHSASWRCHLNPVHVAAARVWRDTPPRVLLFDAVHLGSRAGQAS